MNTFYRFFYWVIIFSICSFIKAKADAISAAELFYHYNNTGSYTVTLNVYQGCSSVSTLSSATPAIKIYKNGILFQTINLDIQPPASGINITPVCNSYADSTTCDNPTSTIPGLLKFSYTGSITLDGSAVWQFVFGGDLGNGHSTTRANSVTNIVGAASIVQLSDTLDNTNGDISSPIFTTLPIVMWSNSLVNYNPSPVAAAITDSLDIQFVPAVIATTGNNVSYVGSITATDPFFNSSFSLNRFTAQTLFVPNSLQNSVAIYNADQYVNGVKTGNCQREMDFKTYSYNSNNYSTGIIDSISSGIIADSTDVVVCPTTDSFSLFIGLSGTDSTGNVYESASGLPPGATFSIANNGTASPQSIFSWNTASVVPGNYTFFITYSDSSCPLNNIQTQAYTIHIATIPPPVSQSPVIYTQGAVATPLTAAGSNILWYSTSGGAPLPSAPVPNTSVADTTYYYVTQGIGSCQSIPDTIEVIVLPATGINSIANNSGLSMYPNPTTGSLNLQYHLSSTERVSIDIIDVLGRTVLKENAILNGNGIKIFDLSALKEGLYAVSIMSDNISYHQDVIKK